MFGCDLVHFGTPSWFINRGEYENTQEHFLPLLKSQFRSKNLLCKIESCNLCINNKYTTNEDNGPLIDLRNSKKLMQRLMIIILQEKYYLKRGEFNIARTELPRSNSITNEIQLDLD